ncbi:class I SAM-dependent methyltransferase [Lysinibacillus xylanilyticus]|uniref:class I SAM-dependent methyltransferase n=1 Tax=Lysinibacillus xylanilyticus TaxID=582475 RepID=UPI003CFCEB4F
MYKNRNYWNEFYSEKNSNIESSSFSRSDFVVGYSPEEYLILELGCGEGADSRYFASRGFEVIGVDGSEAVIAKNKEKTFPNLSFKCVNLSEKEELARLLMDVNDKLQKNNKKLLLYTRFFFHAITEQVESLIIESLLKVIKQDFDLISEFRTKEDYQLYKVHNNHYRRYIDTNIFIKNMLENHFSIYRLVKGQGLSVYHGEDPYLCRIILKKEV